MISNPRVGQEVQVWYNARVAPSRRFHGAIGRVVVASKGRPKNHGILLAGVLVVVPCGNLREPR